MNTSRMHRTEKPVPNYPWTIKFIDGTDATEYQDTIAPLIHDAAVAEERLSADELEMACQDQSAENNGVG
jgi:hypothetical protein